MKIFYQLTFALTMSFLLVIATSPSAFAQANDIKGGPLKAGDLLKDPKPQWRWAERKSG